MSKKSKGTNAERNLISLFWGTKTWCACRVAGSGSSRYPSPDIIAANKRRKVVIEAKTLSQKNKFFSEHEINELVYFAERFGAERYIALKFSNNPWYFISIDDLNKTNKGYSINLESAKNKGILFEELIEEE